MWHSNKDDISYAEGKIKWGATKSEMRSIWKAKIAQNKLVGQNRTIDKLRGLKVQLSLHFNNLVTKFGREC